MPQQRKEKARTMNKVQREFVKNKNFMGSVLFPKFRDATGKIRVTTGSVMPTLDVSLDIKNKCVVVSDNNDYSGEKTDVKLNPESLNHNFFDLYPRKVELIMYGETIGYLYFGQSPMNPELILEGEQSYERTPMKSYKE